MRLRFTRKTGLYLNISCLLDGLYQLDLQQNVVTPEMDARHGRDDDVDLPDGIHEALRIRERALHQSDSLLLEGQEGLELVYVETDLRPLKDIGRVALLEACLHNPTAYVTCSADNKHLALGHICLKSNCSALTNTLFIVLEEVG